MRSGRFPEIEHGEAHGKRSAALGKRASGHFWPSQGYRNLGEAVAASRRLGLSRTCSLRAVEICDLEWSQVEFDRTATLHVRRAKNGKPAAHPIRGDELRALRELQRQTGGGYVFETERGTEAPGCVRPPR